MLQSNPTDRLIRVAGLDPSLRNWGCSVGTYNLDTRKVLIEQLHLINPVLSTSKQVRQNSHDLSSALQLYEGSIKAIQGCDAVFIEVPHGSQSARAMASYGVCVGVLGALRASGFPFFELTADEVKMAGAGNKKASKIDMIMWAMTKHPEAKWPTYTQHGETLVSESKAEHLADATAAIHAGISLPSFQQMLSFFNKQSNERKDHREHSLETSGAG